jgi:cytochrome c553
MRSATIISLATRSLHHQKGLVFVGALAALVGWSSIGAADDAKLKAYGQHLARECTACHRLDGVDNGIPSIIGWPAETFISTMKFYSDGARTNPVMVSVVSSLSDEQLKALAAFFASVPKAEKRPAKPSETKRKP